MQLFKLKFGVLLLSLGATVGACAPDRTFDDYNRQKLNEELSKIQQVEGEYVGVLRQATPAETPLGALSIEVHPDARVDDRPGAPRNSQRAIVRGKVVFETERRLVVDFSNGYYDADSGSFQATVPVTLQTGRQVELNLAGSISDNRLVGKIEADGFPESSGVFNLLRDGPRTDPESLYSEDGAPVIGRSVEIYGGDAVLSHGETRTAELVLLRTDTSTEQAFVHLFVPVETIQATLDFGDSLQFLFQHAQYDRRVGTLRGQALVTRGGESLQLSLECRKSVVVGTPKTWTCRYLNSKVGQVADLVLTAKAERAGDLPGSGTPGAGGWTTSQYQGSATYQENDARDLSVRVLVRDLNNKDDFLGLPMRNVRVTLNLGEGFQLAFPNAEWNQRTKTLRAELNYTIMEKIYDIDLVQVSLECVGLDPVQLELARWTCSLFNNRVGRVAELTLEPGANEPSQTREETSETFRGKVFYHRGTENVARMVFKKPNRPSTAEQVLFRPLRSGSITLISGSGAGEITLGFPTVRWDTETNQIEGRGTAQVGTEVRALSIQCGRWNPEGAPDVKGWRCEYTNSASGLVGTFFLEPETRRAPGGSEGNPS